MRTHLCKSYFSCQNQLNGGRAKYTSLIDVSILNETGRIERKKMNLCFFESGMKFSDLLSPNLFLNSLNWLLNKQLIQMASLPFIFCLSHSEFYIVREKKMCI